MDLGRFEAMGRLSDRIYDILKREILAGRLAPGQHLALEEVSQKLGVSTTPIRDAFGLLAADGLVECLPRRGTFVARLTPTMVKETFQLREFLECAAVEFALQEGAPLVAEMQELAEQMAALAARGSHDDALEYARLEQRFHKLPIECVGNGRLCEIFASLTSIATIGFVLCWPDIARAAEIDTEHRAIIGALASGSAEAARAAVRDHLQNGRADLLRRLSPIEGTA